jgi:hypothetical protein
LILSHKGAAEVVRSTVWPAWKDAPLAWSEIIEIWQLADRIEGKAFASNLGMEIGADTDRDTVILAVQQATLALRPAMTWHQYQLVWNAVTGEMGREDYLVGQVSVGGEDRSEKPR